ncbi:MAG TPA: YdeI/OmpD-associated family protein [Solirubrobacteraceae bacterium]|nr:YdeI/OmpD-associated family protein [Solirubrobacteraceae bacterium]
MAEARFQSTVGAQEGGTFIEVPLDVPAVFGGVRAPVRVTVNGHTYRSTVMRYGDRHYLPLNRANREAAGVAVGDAVDVALVAEAEPRTVEVPEDLAAALGAVHGARAAFDSASFSHRREWVEWVQEAKRPETRERRIGRVVEHVLARA